MANRFQVQRWRDWKPPFLRKGNSARLLFFFHETTWSGAPIQLYHVVLWLKQRGWELAAVVPIATSAQSGAISSELTKLGIQIFPVLDFSVPPDVSKFRSLCAQFDVVVANTLVMWASVRAAHESGVPVIWYVHETLLLWRLLELNPEIQPTLALADVVVFPTHHTARLYASLISRPVEVVPYGIPPAKIPLRPKRDRTRIRFLLLGSYEHRKGQDLFLDAIAQLPMTVQERTLFQMVGRKLDESFYQAIAMRADRPNVLLSDALEHDEALAVTAAADVLVCASRDETMPIAILEAMSLGKAIITTSVGGTTEWLHDGVNALIVPVDDSQALARAITHLVEEPRLIESLGKKGRNTFSAEFSIDQLGRRFTKLFQQAIRNKRS